MAEKKFNDFGASNGFGFDSFIAGIQKQNTDPEEKKPAADSDPAKSRAGETKPQKPSTKANGKETDASQEEIRTPHTLSIRHSIWKTAKAKATQNDTSLSDLVENYLKKYIKS